MQKKNNGFVQSTSGDWRLSFGAVRLHNSHISGGQAVSGSCGICQEGLGGALARVEVEEKLIEKDEVDTGSGADEAGNAASSYDAWYDTQR